MQKVVPFRREHLEWIAAAGNTQLGVFVLTPADMQALEAQNSWTLLISDGTPIGCGGTVEQWKGRHIGWAILRHDAGKHMKAITRVTRHVLELARGRIETTVRADFKNGHRWAKLLGFVVENPPGILKQYGPEGEAHVSYVMFME